VCHCNEHKLYQRFKSGGTPAHNAETEQFITAKISGNSLKQGSKTHFVLRQRSSQLQEYKAEH